MTADLVDSALDLQLQYWRYEEEERRSLESRRDELSWPERLRLLHLYQLQLLGSQAGGEQIENLDFFDDAYAPPGVLYDKTNDLFTELSGPGSPYRGRSASIWQYRSAEDASAEPDISGLLQNISATHLGSLEVVVLNSAQQPTAVEFVPFAQLKAIQFDRNAQFRPVRLHFNDGRDPEVVLTPYFYWASYLSGHPSDVDGTTTRFILSLDVNATDSIGLGEQDFTVGTTIFRLSTIRFIEFQ